MRRKVVITRLDVKSLLIVYAIVMTFLGAAAVKVFSITLPPASPSLGSLSQPKKEGIEIRSRRSPADLTSCEISGNWNVNLVGESCHVPTGFCGPYSFEAVFKFESEGTDFIGTFPDARDESKLHTYTGTLNGDQVSGSWQFPLFMGPECGNVFFFYGTGSFTGALTDCNTMSWMLNSDSWAHWNIETCQAEPDAYFSGTATVTKVVSLDIWYLEINQAVQRIDPDNLTNQVPLIAGKDTVVRAYVRSLDVDQPEIPNVTGALYMSPAGQAVWTPIGTLDPASITALADDLFTEAIEPTPEMLENTLNFRIPDGLPEGSYDLKVEVSLGSDPTVLTEKTINVHFNKRMAFKILYTRVDYNGDLPSGDFSNAYLLLKGTYPSMFRPDQWVADQSPVEYQVQSPTINCGLRANGLFAQLAARMILYNASQPPELQVDYIVGFLANTRLEDGLTGCARGNAVFVTDRDGAINTTLAHEIGHLMGLPIPQRRIGDFNPFDGTVCIPKFNLGCEEYPGLTGIGYLIDQEFEDPIPERKHFFDFSDSDNKVTKFHALFYNFMGLTDDSNSWVDEKTYEFLYHQLEP